MVTKGIAPLIGVVTEDVVGTLLTVANARDFSAKFVQDRQAVTDELARLESGCEVLADGFFVLELASRTEWGTL